MANNFLKFCEDDIGTNLLSQVDYAADGQRLIGNQPGIARAKLVNKVLRQCAYVAHNICQYMENVTGDSVLDDDNDANMLTTIGKAFGKGVGFVSKTSNYTATLSDDVILCDTTGGAFTISLPAAATSTRKVLTIKLINDSDNNLTIDANGGEFIDGALTQVLNMQWQFVTIACNGTAWYII